MSNKIVPPSSPTAIKTTVPPPPTVDGLNKFHADFIAYLYKDHGQFYNSKVKQIEESFSTTREQIAYILMGLNCVYMIFGSGAEFVCNLIGIAYPCYVSVKAIRSDQTDDDTQWLIYWSVFATFSLVDFFAQGIMSIFPFYWIAKMAFLMYLYLPQTQGSVVIYNGLVDPLVTILDGFLAHKEVDMAKIGGSTKMETARAPSQQG